MSCEAGNNSVGSPSPHITTPQRTPTSAAFADDILRTPRVENELLGSSGWTPVFAEEYSLFNATPGRFTDTQGTFETSSPRPTSATGHKRQHSSTETLRADSANSTKIKQGEGSPSTFGHLGLLSLSAIRSLVPGGGLNNIGEKTPKKAAQPLESAITGQTATPPNSRHKHARRNSAADAKNKMQNEQDFYAQGDGMGGGFDLSFATPTNVDLFSFPMSGPATAPAYMNGKSFWDPSNTMTDMSMDYSGDPLGTSGADWAGYMFPLQQMNTPPLQQNTAQSSRKPRPLLAKPPAASMPPVNSGVTFDFGMAALSEDSFQMPSTSGAVNPNHLFGFPNMTPSLSSNAFNATAAQANSQASIHRQPTLLSPLAIPRSQSAQWKRPDSSHMRRPISPLKSSRPGTHRTTSDNLKRPPALKAPTPLSADAQPPSNFAGKGRYSSGTGGASNASGRLSPTKQGSRTNRHAISEKGEKLFNPRTAVTFSIDANGRARTETTVIMENRGAARPRSSNSRTSAHETSPMSGSNTDEDVIVIPSRNPSFAQKDKNRALSMPKMARFDTQVKQYPRAGGRKLSAGNVRVLSKAALALNNESDDEVIDTATRSSGDASKALRRVMENRRRSVSGITSMPPSSNTQTIRIQSSHGGSSSRDRERHYRRQSFSSSSTTAYSASTPTTVTDLDLDVEMCDTPSTVASEVTRCVCHRREREGNEFMIQCESCEHWQHSTCVKIDPRELPKVYICAFCAQTPNMRGGRMRDKHARRDREMVLPDSQSPLGMKSFR